MKKKLLFVGTLLAHGFVFSQNIFPTTTGSNVGIGTTIPSTSLQITSATAGTSGLRLTNLTNATSTTTGNNKALSVDGIGNIILTPVVNNALTDVSLYNNNGTLSSNRTVTMSTMNLTFSPSTANSQFFINGTNGNVGIGILAPTEKLEVVGKVKASQGIFSNNLSNGQTFTSYADRNDKCVVLATGNIIGTGIGYVNTRMFNYYDFPISNFNAKPEVFFGIEDRNDKGRFRMKAEAGGNGNLIMLDKAQSEVFQVIDDGNNNIFLQMAKPNSFVGIGTTSFTDGVDTYKLSVKGSVRADRVKVYTTWADYVFEKNYNLPTLEDVEKHIKEKGHLKDIPSAKEVEKNGIELGEMNKLLLQKVEELTLYIIQLNKELKTMKTELKKK